MKKQVLSAIFSLSGISIIIGVIGFTSSVATLFVDINSNISIKWLLFFFVLAASLILILLKIIYDLIVQSTAPSTFEIPIRYIPQDNILVIRKNENFLNSIIVGCYQQKDEIDRLVYLGYVYLVQDRVIQIKLTHDMNKLEKSLNLQKN